MNEYEWLTCTNNPVAMLISLPPGHSAYHRAGLIDDSVALCDMIREVYANPFRPMAFARLDRNLYLVRSPNGENVIKAGPNVRFMELEPFNPLDQNLSDRELTITEVIGTPVTVLDPDWLTWKDGTIPKMVSEILEELCDCVYDVNLVGRHNRCNGTGHIPRAEPQFAMMPVLADALEAAGCTEAAILDHLRGAEKCVWCDGSGRRLPLFPHKCSRCNGAGKRPPRHVVDCWALRLLTEKDS